GVAAFARSSWMRLLLVQFIVAAVVASAVVWFLNSAWFPTIQIAVRQLPVGGEIRAGKLIVITQTPQLLAERHFFALAVDLDPPRQIRSLAHVQVELGRSDVRIISLLGYVAHAYPSGASVAFNRAELEPWWGAWRPPILWLTFAGVIVWLLILWPVLA